MYDINIINKPLDDNIILNLKKIREYLLFIQINTSSYVIENIIGDIIVNLINPILNKNKTNIMHELIKIQEKVKTIPYNYIDICQEIDTKLNYIIESIIII